MQLLTAILRINLVAYEMLLAGAIHAQAHPQNCLVED